jgi:hypothetical protein
VRRSGESAEVSSQRPPAHERETVNATAQRRRWLVGVGGALLVVGLVVGGGHRGQHAARSLIVPGGGLLDTHRMLGTLFIVAGAIATVLWLRWGLDWVLVAIVLASAVTSAVLARPTSQVSADVVTLRSAHEFPLVLLVVALIGWIRATLGSVPGFAWMRGRSIEDDAPTRPLRELPPVDRCRAITIKTLAGRCSPDDAESIDADDVARRSRLIGIAARVRVGGDPFRVDHAHVRTARAASGLMDADEHLRFIDDAKSLVASEPTFVRLLDAVLTRAALVRVFEGAHHRATEPPDPAALASPLVTLLTGPLAARRGHRRAWWWTPLGVSGGRCTDWEQAAATAIAHAFGWVDDTEWAILRQRVLGAAARGASRRDDERLIAAGRVWLAQVPDDRARQIISRPRVRHDPIAVALDGLAESLSARPGLGRPASVQSEGS